MILNETLLPISVWNAIFFSLPLFFFSRTIKVIHVQESRGETSSVLLFPTTVTMKLTWIWKGSELCGERGIMNDKDEERTLFNVPCDIRKNVSSEICSPAVVACCVSHKIFLLLGINNKNSFRVKIRDKSIPVFESFFFGCRNELCKTNIKHRLDHPNAYSFRWNKNICKRLSVLLGQEGSLQTCKTLRTLHEAIEWIIELPPTIFP